jgi:chemotaxis protein methyltransferase CheR
VLIYFTEEAKAEVFSKFCNSLSRGGILFIGSTEQIINYKEIGFERKNSFYYEKPAGV